MSFRICGLYWLFSGAIALSAAGYSSSATAQEIDPGGRLICLPIEVCFPDMSSVQVELTPPPRVICQRIAGLRLRIHGLEYDGQASVRINDSPWIELNNRSVNITEPARSYDGIGGGFTTLDLTIAISGNTDLSQRNQLGFRFNHTDGVSSSFRVLGIAYVDSNGKQLDSVDHFVWDNPGNWETEKTRPEDIVKGRGLWRAVSLLASGVNGAAPIHAHCADCHTSDGRDLKYFGFSNRSIIARSMFHGLTAEQGQLIAGYIRSLPFPSPGRPWNPPYQPGPGLSQKPIGDWAAGAGLESTAANDADTLKHLFGDAHGLMRITPAAFDPDSQTDIRSIPIPFQLPDWNHWLPHVHPVDAWGPAFSSNPINQAFESLHAKLDSTGKQAYVSNGQIIESFNNWTKARNAFLAARTPGTAQDWNRSVTDRVYSTQLWQLVKTWEIIQAYSLEERWASQMQAGSTGERGWPNLIPLATAPAELGIPNTPAGMNGSGLVTEYFNNAWYELQKQVDGSNHGRNSSLRISWVYILGHYLQLQRLSGLAEPARTLLAIIRSIQAVDPTLAPDNADGWKPNRVIDPRIFIDAHWATTFAALDTDTRTQLTSSFLSAWLSKCRRYSIGSYFTRFSNARDYKAPPEIGNVSGGGVWNDATRFREAGVSASLIHQLREWGRLNEDMATRFHY